MASQDSKEMQEPSSAGFGLLRTEMLERVNNIRQVSSPDSPLLPKVLFGHSARLRSHFHASLTRPEIIELHVTTSW